MTRGRGITIAPKTAPAPVTACAHHWIVSTPDGPTCDAWCKKCNETRVYPTVIRDENGFSDLSLIGSKYARVRQ